MSSIYTLLSSDRIDQTFDDINTNFSNLNTDKLQSTDLKTVNWNSLVWSGDIVISGGGSVATDTIWDAKWDLAGGTGANTASRLAVGTNWQVLTADSAEATGLKWTNPAGGWDALTSWTLAQFAPTTSAQLAGVISDETWSGGFLVFSNSPALTTPSIAAINVTGGTLTLPTGASDTLVWRVSTDTFSTGVKTFLNWIFWLRNVANTFTSFFTNTNTASRTYTLKDANGTLAFTTDITGTNSGTNTGDETTSRINALYGTSNAITVGSVEVWHATDTTITRVSAGVIAVEGVTVPTISSTSTITGKRNQPRIVSATSYTTDTGTSLDFSTCDIFIVTAQAGALKFNNPSGTPQHGEKIIIRIKDNWTARALTYDTQYRAVWVTLPTTTVISKTLYLGGVWNTTDTKLDIIAVSQEA